MSRVLRLEKTAWGKVKTDTPIEEAIKELPVGSYLVVFEKRGSLRTIPQNNLFWLWMTALEDFSGTSRVVWHDYYCRRYLPPDTGTSSLSREAMRNLMDNIQADALTEWGVTLPSPEDEALYLEFIQNYRYR